MSHSNALQNTITPSKSRVLLACLLLLVSLNSEAKKRKSPPPEPEVVFEEMPEYHAELDLRIPDNQWLDEIDTEQLFQAPKKAEPQQLAGKKSKKRPLNVDCGMDVNPNLSIDNSLGNRLTGECDVQYRY
jgi:hypothetical protein